jgi:formylglycine-generating enzyme required for sulfatase activity
MGLVVALACPPAQAAEWVLVGDPGNPDDQEAVIRCCDYKVPDPKPSAAGGVDYFFRIMRHELTNAEWVEFLNAIAADDLHGVYLENEPNIAGLKGFDRNGVAGSYSYSVRPGMEQLPVIGIDWMRAARYSNWLHNGRPKGPQGPDSTEGGAYDLATYGELAQREPGARYWIPSTDEMYKAAYYDPEARRYWDFGIRGHDITNPPEASLPPGGANYCPPLPREIQPAVDCELDGVPGPGGASALTPVGAYEGESAYGLREVVGNVAEVWEDRQLDWDGRVVFSTRGNSVFWVGPRDNESRGRHYVPATSNGLLGVGLRLAASPGRGCGIGAELTLLLILLRGGAALRLRSPEPRGTS